MVARYTGDGRDLRPIIGMVVAANLDTWTVEWYDANNKIFRIRYEASTIHGYANAYNRLRKSL